MTSNPVSADHMRRLMIVKYLYRVGIDQAKQKEPVSSLSILSFHDAVEMMLQLCIERTDSDIKLRPDFADYWMALDKSGHTASEQQGMRRLNSARVSLKHHGVLSSEADIYGFRSLVTNFIENECYEKFGLRLAEVTRSALIVDQKVRSTIVKAESAATVGDLKNVMEYCAYLFSLLRGYATNFNAIYDFTHRIGSFSPFSSRGEIADIPARNAIEALESRITDAFFVIACGADLTSYRVLSGHGPQIHRFANGDHYEAEWMKDAPTDPEISNMCLEFIVDLALRLQSVEPYSPPKLPGLRAIKLPLDHGDNAR